MKHEAVVISIPTIVKSHVDNGRRIVEVQASSETVDADGDLIRQVALLGSAAEFVAKGHLDIDHKSEFGLRWGIKNPASYVVGRPLEVKDIGNGNTSVIGEISKARDGSFDPSNNKFDELWQSLQCDPPVHWYSSVYGFPTDWENHTAKSKSSGGPSRYLIKGFDWRSLAFTRAPKNTALHASARIVTAKSFMRAIAKGEDPYAEVVPGNGMEAIMAMTFCQACDIGREPSMRGYRKHFLHCEGLSADDSDVYAHAVMHKLNREIASAYGNGRFLP